jgi:hypothetical protein
MLVSLNTLMVRILIVLSGAIFAASAVMREWKLGILAIVVMIVAQVYGLVTTRARSHGKVKELLKGDGDAKP